jgi:hypothetical protein
MKPPPPDDPLDPLLDRWSSTPDPSPRLGAEVWQRIATGGSEATVTRGPWATFETWVERPVFAMGFVAACALLGLFLAELRIGQVQRERNAQLARSYLQLIDPLVTSTEPENRS